MLQCQEVPFNILLDIEGGNSVNIRPRSIEAVLPVGDGGWRYVLCDIREPGTGGRHGPLTAAQAGHTIAGAR